MLAQWKALNFLQLIMNEEPVILNQGTSITENKRWQLISGNTILYLF